MTRRRTLWVAVLAVLALAFASAAPVWAQGTIAPVARQTFLDSNGHPLSFGRLYTFSSGTTTPTPIYADSSLTVPLSNPAILDVAGRLTYYLAPATYRFTLKTSTDVLVWDQDQVSATSPFTVNLDISGVACESLSAGDAVYLSDGSGSKTAGCWYKASATNTYSSTDATVIGMVPSAIANAATGSIRLSGVVSTASGVSVGTDYYIGATAGSITATAPTNQRKLGRTDSTATIVVTELPATPNANNGAECFRLTLTTGTPVTIGDVTSSTLFASPYGCNRIALFDSLGNATLRTSAEFSIAVPATTATMYDVYAFSNAGVPTLELLAWTNDTTRATNIGFGGIGVYVKFGDFTRRYLGTIRTGSVSGVTENSRTKRYVWNYYNRVPQELARLETTTSWPYTLATVRQANGSTTNQVEVVVGVQESAMTLSIRALVSNSGGGAVHATVGIGLDSTTTFLAPSLTMTDLASGLFAPLTGTIVTTPPIGRHVYSWNEYSVASATTTWYGVDPVFGGSYYGLTGWIEGD